ncbi:small ribosomal subunit protein uS14m [Euwallacea similis]|uniref:small ribosomal subunit protein uS14m n=1 Tax=Euwallacea similis TaxID=1736056 RepID=UPI00344F5607
MNFTRNLSNLLFSHTTQTLQQVRHKWVNRWMIRDVKRRKAVVEYAPTRLRINSLRKNNILPPELQEIATADIAALPRDSIKSHMTRRCVITSRPRGTVPGWRLSRIVFRHLADYNKLAGIQRAMW